MRTRRTGFTLIELLVVISILAVLMGLLFPVFASARRRAHQSNCTSNLRQIGVALRLYADDHDDYFARANDPVDRGSNLWQHAANGAFWPEARDLPPLTDALAPYIRSPELWRCPSDNGFTFNDVAQVPLNARPTSFRAFGASYYYLTELGLRRQRMSRVRVYDFNGRVLGPSDIVTLFDGQGTWHGRSFPVQRRYGALCADGRVAVMDEDRFSIATMVSFTPPS